VSFVTCWFAIRCVKQGFLLHSGVVRGAVVPATCEFQFCLHGAMHGIRLDIAPRVLLFSYTSVRQVCLHLAEASDWHLSEAGGWHFAEVGGWVCDCMTQDCNVLHEW